MKFSQKSVTYHGCGSCYLDDANIIESKSKLCFFPTHEPFWKDPKDVSNKIAKSTRNQLKKKTIASRNYRKKYFRYQRYNGKGTILLFPTIGQAVQKIVTKHTIAMTTNQS